MEEAIRDAAMLLANIVDKTEQDCAALAASLEGDIMDAYRRVVQRELGKLRAVEAVLLREADEQRGSGIQNVRK